jgi:alkanesulfonate monooxygenase SsuD/methylene tetrahydromethanopterin reductase-like flavin-dependent oxidoreductase (luciferase family)
MHSHGFVADTDEEALQQLWPHYAAVHARIGRERGWPPMTRQQFETAAGPEGALFAGSPSTVAEKIVNVVSSLGLSRLDLKSSAGTLPHDLIMRNIELYGTKVAPQVRSELSLTSPTKK